LAESAALINWQEQGIVSLQQKLADFVQQMQSMIEINQNGLPIQYVDPTVITECVPYAETLDDIPEDKYKYALKRIDYEEGVPVVDGTPFWERLDGEKIEYYNFFKDYRTMKYFRQGDEEYVVRNRSLAALAEKLGVPGKLITILSKIYHWMPRCRAYDIYKEREIAQRKQIQAMELESKHAKYANQVLEQAILYLNTHTAQLNPKVALQMVELGMKYGRISVGLQGDKPGAQSAAVHQTNIAISQSNTQNSAEQMAIISGGGDIQGRMDKSQMSDVERQLAEKMKTPDTLISILHVLNKSGAFSTAVASQNPDDEDNDNAEEVEIEANYEVKEGEE